MDVYLESKIFLDSAKNIPKFLLINAFITKAYTLIMEKGSFT